MKHQPKKSGAEIEEIIGKIQFQDRKFHLLEKGDGYLLQLSYMEACSVTGNLELQKSRKYYISPWMTESEIVETAWLCVTRSLMHVASEWFTYEGLPIYSQHFSLQARVAACSGKAYDSRLPPKTKKEKSADHASVLGKYVALYREATGDDPIITARTGKAAKDLLKLMPLEEVLLTIETAFQDDWFNKSGRELHYVAGNVNKWRTKPEAPPPVAKPVVVDKDSLGEHDARPIIEELQKKLVARSI